MKKVYDFAPLHGFNKTYADEELFIKYGFTEEEIEFIDSMVRSMEL